MKTQEIDHEFRPFLSPQFDVDHNFFIYNKSLIYYQFNSMQPKEDQLNKINSQSVVFQKKWFGIKHLNYTIRGKECQKYEAAFRPTQQNSVDGVEIIPIIKKIDNSLEIVLIANFRPPVGKFCLEFPAGMVEGLDYQENALRELKEETGYIAEKILKVPEVLINCDPWKSCEGGFLYIGIINEADPKHKINQNLEQSENIRVYTFKIEDNLPENISKFAENHGFAVHTKLWTFILGLTCNHLFV